MLLAFLLKLWIIDIDFGTIVSFLIGIFLGAMIICAIYGIMVLSSVRNKTFLVKNESDDLTTTEVKEMILLAQKSFKDKALRGETKRVQHCMKLVGDLASGIASRFYPKSKYPLLELSIDEALMLVVYVEKRLEEIIDRPGLRLFKKIKVSTIYELTTKTNQVMDTKAFKAAKEVSNTVSTIKKVVNIINPAWWFRKVVIDNTVNIITERLCLVVLAIVGEEVYKIYSKMVFNKDVNISSNVDDILTQIDKSLKDASKEVSNEEEANNAVNDDVVLTMEDDKKYLSRPIKKGFDVEAERAADTLKKHKSNIATNNEAFASYNEKYNTKESENNG
ncbi:MAG: hypothetical protein J6R47_05485 [Acholeplasmatales bacterium]|nr:hypothetical protein [Acholeplasmatales bacterium]